MSDITDDLDTRLNNIEKSVDILQDQIDMIIETIEEAVPKMISNANADSKEEK
jgi:chaperonin cofactor prefoldin